MMKLERTTSEVESIPARHAALTLDVHGRITHCNPAAATLLGRTLEGLSGDAAAAVIQGLPFAANTPGYNMAYAVLHAADGAWTRRTAVLADGRHIPIEAALSIGKVDGQHRITVTFAPTPAVACL